MNEGDNPPIGIILCADKSDSVVKYTLPEDNTQIFASKYMTYLPTEEELKRELKLDEYVKLDDVEDWYRLEDKSVFCPKCKGEYRDGFYVCADCNVDLVEKLEEEMKVTDELEKITVMDPVKVFSSSNELRLKCLWICFEIMISNALVKAIF